jgi:hypothetical protein
MLQQIQILGKKTPLVGVFYRRSKPIQYDVYHPDSLENFAFEFGKSIPSANQQTKK